MRCAPSFRLISLQPARWELFIIVKDFVVDFDLVYGG